MNRFAFMATALLAAGSAFAQSSVTIYGIADGGIEYSDPRDGGATTSVISGGRSGSRLGFRGNEDLGGSLSAQFVLEQGYSIDDGTLRQGGRTFGRQAYVALRGGLGTVAVGRLASFSSGTGSFDFVGDLDAMLTSYGIASVGSTFSSANSLRADNTVLWASPIVNGFRAGLAHSLQFDGEEVPDRSHNMHVTMAGLRYAEGPFAAALTYDVANNPDGGSDESHLQLLAAYDFKVVKLYAGFALESNQFSPDFNVTGTTSGADASAYMVGLSAPLGSGTFRVSWQSRDADRVDDDERDLSLLSLAYEYPLSKRTSLYAVANDVRGSHTFNNDPEFDRRVLTTGIYHRF